jgi:hypothetical protein
MAAGLPFWQGQAGEFEHGLRGASLGLRGRK